MEEEDDTSVWNGWLTAVVEAEEEGKEPHRLRH